MGVNVIGVSCVGDTTRTTLDGLKGARSVLRQPSQFYHHVLYFRRTVRTVTLLEEVIHFHLSNVPCVPKPAREFFSIGFFSRILQPYLLSNFVV